MPVYTTDVEVDLDDFSDWELQDELEYRGYCVSSEGFNKIEELSDSELVGELENRGYTVYGDKADIPFQIYQSYLLDTPEQFKKCLEQLFIENGFKP